MYVCTSVCVFVCVIESVWLGRGLCGRGTGGGEGDRGGFRMGQWGNKGGRSEGWELFPKGGVGRKRMTLFREKRVKEAELGLDR